MRTPNRIPHLSKTSVVLAMSCLTVLSSTAIQPPLATAQVNPDLSTELNFEPPTNSSPGRGTVVTTTGTYFRPPSNPRSRSGTRTTTGTRQGSCTGSPSSPFTIFGPDANVGQTISTHPSFTWFLPDSEEAFPITFRILAANEAGIPEPIYVTELEYIAGFMRYQLPSDMPPLSPGQEYRWQVIVECNPYRPSQSLVQELSFEVVALSPTLSQQLTSSSTAVDRGVTYGTEGIWYDAIAEVAEADTIEAKQARTGLLQDLAVAADNERLSQNLLAIAEMTSD